MRWWYLGQYYPLFEMQSSIHVDFPHSYVVFFNKDFAVKFFIGSFAVKQRVCLVTATKVSATFEANVQHIG